MTKITKKTRSKIDVQNHPISKFNIGVLSAALTAFMCASLSPSYAADIEIYKVPEDSVGSTTLMMMLDLSGSMTDKDNVGISRIQRLKNGLIDVLQGTATTPKVDDKIVMGLATFNYNNGFIRLPAKRLGDVTNSKTKTTHRDDLITTINGLNAGGGTPTPYAYAEAAAYLMGQSPISSDNLQSYFVSNDWRYRGYYKTCVAWNGDVCTTWIPDGNSWYRNFPFPSSYRQSNTGNLGLSGNYYIGRGGSNLEPFSGFDDSTNDSKDGNTYIAPSSITDQFTNVDKKECSGQGIYFLTDGQPEPGGAALGTDGKSGTAYTLMSRVLGTKGAEFSCNGSLLGNRLPYVNNNNGWSCIGNFAQALLDPTKNPVGLKIQTVVVGFGRGFGAGATETNDVRDAKDWGRIGGGGWIAGSSSEDVSKSINNFIQALNKDIPSMSTGSSTIPLDALNPERVQPYSYFPQFEPKVRPEDKQQVWFGNLKKFNILNNSIYSADKSTLVVKDSKVQDVNDLWNSGNIQYDDKTPIYQKGGALSRLILGTVPDVNPKTTGRKLLTNYDFDATRNAANPIQNNPNLVQVKYSYTTDNATKSDTKYARPLMALLGYDIGNNENTNGLDLTNRNATIRQMGSVYHSNPVLLTQKGKMFAELDKTNQVVINSKDRQDYALFGTTQGLVSVVDAATGFEKFAFVPKEIIEKQSETFMANAGNLSGGKNALYYGMDGEWTAQTVYVSGSDGTLSVNGASRKVPGSTSETINLAGKQWVYGGMRMGGRSYYSLDLTNIDNPSIKFQIDPSSGLVYSKQNPNGKSFPVIKNMGQSWSKPKLDYINWQGQRKLVMIVGGGYDAGGDDGDGLKVNGIRTGYAGYEKYDYKQESSTSSNKQIGAGVYMFDADNGDLLWSTNATSNASVQNTALKYSVVSEIKTVDRNNDGVIDHLYFGDLAGQAFRVDFKNDGSTNFTAQVNKILDVHEANGTSPRFYLPPTFTAHRSSARLEGGNVVMATFVSGNKSSPLLGTPDSPSDTGKQNTLGLQYDAVFAVYDYDIFPDGVNYPVGTKDLPLKGARTRASANDTASTSKLKLITATTNAKGNTGAMVNASTGWGGWYYLLKTKFNGQQAEASIIKGLSPLIAMGGSLYVTMYDAADNGTSTSCGAGVKGNSFTKRICLPTGVCPEDATYSYNLGSGIIAPQVGPGVGAHCTGDNCKTLIIPDPNPTNLKCEGDACDTTGGKFFATGGSMRFIPNRWYERYANTN